MSLGISQKVQAFIKKITLRCRLCRECRIAIPECADKMAGRVAIEVAKLAGSVELRQ